MRGPLKNGIWSMLVRYGRLLIFFGASLYLVTSNAAFGIFGTLIYLPVLLSGSVVAALVVRHCFFKATLDDDAHSGFFTYAWRGLSARERALANLAVICVFILAAAIIAAALIR